MYVECYELTDRDETGNECTATVVVEAVRDKINPELRFAGVFIHRRSCKLPSVCLDLTQSEARQLARELQKAVRK